MGWGRYFFLGDLGQQLDINDQKQEIMRLRGELERRRMSGDRGGDFRGLQAGLDELRLYMAAVVRLLVAKGLVSRQELSEVIEAVDQEDGTRDGRHDGPIA